MAKRAIVTKRRGRGPKTEMLINWMIGVEAIVAVNEDPEHQHRIKVVIPILDEQKIYDKWVRPLGVPVLGQGYGGFYVPPKDSEVILFGRLGQKHNLFYLPSFNEDYEVSMDFRNEDGSPRSDDVCGVRAPGDLKHIAEGDYQLRAGRVFIETDGSVRIIAPGGIFMNGKRVA